MIPFPDFLILVLEPRGCFAIPISAFAFPRLFDTPKIAAKGIQASFIYFLPVDRFCMFRREGVVRGEVFC